VVLPCSATGGAPEESTFVYRRALTFSLVLTIVGIAHAQSGRRNPIQSSEADQDASSSGDSEIRLEVDEVRLNVKVQDPGGNPVRGLDRTNFIVAENGERQKIVSFASERAPANVVLVLDSCSDVYTELDEQGSPDRPKPIVVATPSILDRVLGPPYQPPPIRIDPLADLAFTRTVAHAIIDRLGPNDRVSIIQASRKVELLQDWTGDHAAARHAVSWRYRLGEATALWDAVYLAASEQLARVDGQRIVVMVSDGVDTASRLSRTDASASLDRTGASVYMVSSARIAIAAAGRYLENEGRVLAPRRRQAMSAIRALQVSDETTRGFAVQSGGAFFAIEARGDPATVAGAIFDELQTAYVLSYVSSDVRRDGAWRAIDVYFDRPGLTARTRRGYYASARRE
jgi:VWFA-related protein